MSVSTQVVEAASTTSPPRLNRSAVPPREAVVHFLDPEAPAIGYERILRIQGYSDLRRVRPTITAAAREMAQLASGASRPRVAYLHSPIRSFHDDALEVATGACFRSAAFQARLSNCVEVVPFVLSCGAEIGCQVIELADKGDLLEAVLLETAGWLCIEDATRQFTAFLRREADSRECRVTSRMGPGYSYRIGDEDVIWPLEDQAILFGLFGDAELPASLMSSSAMNPKLSRSGLYGITRLSPAQAALRGSASLN